MQLRDYQQNMKDRLYDAWTKVSSVMLQMPTGTGKTHLMAAVIRENMEAGVLVVAHRIELIEQISKTLDDFEVPHGIINRKTVDINRVTEQNRVVVASIQTLSGRINQADFKTGIIVVDEAHHAVAKTYRLLWEKWPEAKFLGFGS